MPFHAVQFSCISNGWLATQLFTFRDHILVNTSAVSSKKKKVQSCVFLALWKCSQVLSFFNRLLKLHVCFNLRSNLGVVFVPISTSNNVQRKYMDYNVGIIAPSTQFNGNQSALINLQLTCSLFPSHSFLFRCKERETSNAVDGVIHTTCS